jgi:hypothetical protein
MVSTLNAPALRFYREYGFIRTRLVKRYYGAGRDAWRMRLQPKTTPSGRGSVTLDRRYRAVTKGSG